MHIAQYTYKSNLLNLSYIGYYKPNNMYHSNNTNGFLEAELLYKPLCLLVGLSVGLSVGRSVGRDAIWFSERISRLALLFDDQSLIF